MYWRTWDVHDMAGRAARIRVNDNSAFGSIAVDQFVQPRYADFAKGVVDLGNVVFFVACTALLLFLTVKVVESRRWR